MVFENILVQFHEKICVVKINRPESLNALNEKTYKEISECFLELEKNSDVDVILLTGEGRSFVAGADISFMKDLTTKAAKEFGILGTNAFNAVENINKVVIGVINGFALGGGCELAMACDIRLASDKAKLGQPEVALGITPGSGGTQRLPRLVGVAKAKELIYTGSIIDAYEAEKIGLVNKVIEHDKLMDSAFEMAKKISSNAKLAVQYSKEAINKGIQVDEATSMFIESSLFGLCFSTADQKEGMAAFLEKRKPNFTNK
ncbi:enoyl-CoA hydratase-related protein [Cetobacterium sp.]|uniref:enoyl-CoA hydratase-related protein n=2 Tax=Cetobacterium sp. TaxID=2071632 RepID=UPI0025D7F579|nr:enoyl-CoA hydratase-related protein [uncultured Cetobacterium sp.]